MGQPRGQTATPEDHLAPEPIAKQEFQYLCNLLDILHQIRQAEGRKIIAADHFDRF